MPFFFTWYTQPSIFAVSHVGAASWAFWPAEASGRIVTSRGNLTIENASSSTMLAMPTARSRALTSRSER